MLNALPATAIGAAAILSMAVAAAAYAWRAGRAERIPAIGLVAIFAAITQLPLPARGGPDSTDGGEPPLLRPLKFVDGVGRRLNQDYTALEWLRDLTMTSTALNLHACIVIGAALALCVMRFRVAVLIGAAMTLAAETAQITGLFGLYACPYRQFEVDDLILNLSGVAIGYLLARRVRRVPLRRSDR